MATGLDVQVLPEEDGVMIKEIIYGRLALSRGLLRRMKSGGAVYLNGEKAYITQRVKMGDNISIEFADAPTNLEPEPLSLDIVYEDDSLLVINKAADMAVYPTRSYPNGTLANGLAHLWKEQGLERKVRLVHRLDRETSGVLLVAKEPYAYRNLAEQLRTTHLKRTYLAIVQGCLPEKSGEIVQPIGRPFIAEGHSLQRAVVPWGKKAATHYRVIKEYDQLSLVELQLTTGRTHQIRVHLAWLGYPILGDEMYHTKSKDIHRQALHAWSLQFIHPRSGEQLSIRASLPLDMVSILHQNKGAK